MSTHTQTVTLSGDRHFGRRIPPQAIAPVLGALPRLARQSVAMAFQGRSTARRKNPDWLRSASDIRFIDHQGDDETVLVFEAPTLGEAAAELFAQQEFWSTRPDPDLTAFDLVGQVVREVAARNEDSDLYDARLLDSLAGFDKALGKYFRDLRLDSMREGTAPAVIGPEVIGTAQSFRDTTPLPRRVRVVGMLDMVRASTQSFALRLDDGVEVVGVLASGSVVDAAARLNRRVLVLGKAVYRASGRLLRIDADEITAAEGESSIWSRVPPPMRRKLDLAPYGKPQGPRSGMSAILGRWPGDETDEEIREALERLS